MVVCFYDPHSIHITFFFIIKYSNFTSFRISCMHINYLCHTHPLLLPNQPKDSFSISPSPLNLHFSSKILDMEGLHTQELMRAVITCT